MPVSAKSKSKLQQFHFKNPDAESTNEKAAQNQGLSKTAPIIISDSSDKENHGTSGEDEKSSLVAAKPIDDITTPSTRFPWQHDFKGTVNEKDEEEVTPTERLLWHNERDTVAAAISPLLPRKGRKRARSSSPVSSPAHAKPNTPAVNIKKLAQALKSPYADPALDLWDRFSSVGLDSAKGLGSTNPALAHLMVSSSPRPSKDAAASQSESSLRRAISCGTNWPKRRRVERPETESPTGSRGLPRQNSKSSMVSALLQTVTGEINKSQEVQERDRLMRSPSPQKRRSPRKAVTPRSTALHNEVAAGCKPSSNLIFTAEDASSDYGDDDFDDDTFMEIDASLVPTSLGVSPAVNTPVLAANTRNINVPNKVDDDDEFGDLDDDVFAEAEDLIAEIASMPTSQMNNQILPQNQAPLQRPSFGGGTKESQDAYGDDFGGDFDFEAAELAATRSLSQKAASLPHVCVYR